MQFFSKIDSAVLLKTYFLIINCHKLIRKTKDSIIVTLSYANMHLWLLQNKSEKSKSSGCCLGAIYEYQFKWRRGSPDPSHERYFKPLFNNGIEIESVLDGKMTKKIFFI